MNQQAKRIKELFGYARTLTKEQGIGTMCVRAAGFFKRRFFGKRARYWPSNMALEAQRSDPAAETFPIISILTPLYNTPQNFLTEFLDNVENQTAHNWQLCLADASDDAHTYVGELVQKHVAANPRIRYVKIENKGIAANTNAAARLAQGEYLALADHDDILAPHAIYCMGKELQKTGADFAYSDEALFRKSPKTAHVAHFKPDYAPEYLRACNYICHLAVFRKSLFDAIGGERPECDGAQDHDLFLRLIDAMQAKDANAAPLHIPQVLYYPDDTIQHAGIITGLGGYAGHSHKYHKRGGSGYMFRLATVQDYSACTAACLLVRTSAYDAVGGLDEAFTVAFNDVDFCLRLREKGWRIVWTPYAELYHHESKSRGSDEEDPVKKARFAKEQARLYEVHGKQNILHDPYYNPNLSLDYEDFRESGDLRNLKNVTL